MEDSPKAAFLTKRRLVVLVCSIAAYAGIVFTGVFQGFNDSLETWKGYYTLVVPASLEVETLQDKLEQAGIRHPLSAVSARVDIAGYGEIIQVPLEKVSSHFLPDDYRKTGWTENVHKLFSDDAGLVHIVYIPREEALATIMIKLQLALGQMDGWQVLEWNPQDRLIMLLFSLSVAVLLIIAAKGYRIAVVAAVFPWMLIASSLGPRMFPAMIAVFLAWCLLSERMIPALRRYVFEHEPDHFFWELIHKPAWVLESFKSMKPFFRYPGLWPRLLVFVSMLVGLVPVMLLSGDREGLGGFVAVAVIAWPAIWIWTAYRYAGTARKSEHQLFSPVPILSRGAVLLSPQSRTAFVLLALAIGCTIVFGGIGRSAAGARIPVPAGLQEGPALSMQNVRNAHAWSDRNGLPDYSMWVSHRAWQESLGYRIPRPGERESFPAADTSYSLLTAPRELNRTVTMEKVLSFDDSWLLARSAASQEYAADRLMTRQGYVFGLAYSSRHRLYSADTWNIAGLVALAFLCTLLAVVSRKTAFVWGFQRFFEWGKKSPA